VFENLLQKDETKVKPLFTELTEAVSANTDGLCKHRFSPYDDHYLNYNFFTQFPVPVPYEHEI